MFWDMPCSIDHWQDDKLRGKVRILNMAECAIWPVYMHSRAKVLV